jgi:hypothetical protein
MSVVAEAALVPLALTAAKDWVALAAKVETASHRQ